ncbi:MAG: phosphoribosylformylglycinamidine synthase [Clostridiales bacterium]|jgi:phosphoribosylformylglycinamidine synthase|nr:phosphoribosylformylglycinamidine synthase [Clostridiales bacterium]
MSVKRVYVEKKKEYRREAAFLVREARELLGLKNLTDLRALVRYDVEGIHDALFERAKTIVFSEPPLDDLYDSLPEGAPRVFAVEYLPGQFDQRANSAAECIQLMSAPPDDCPDNHPVVRAAMVYLLYGDLTEEEWMRFKQYAINPVEAREASLEARESLAAPYAPPALVARVSLRGGSDLLTEYGLAMDAADIAFCRDYFRAEGRDPTLTELRVIDAYWSDHCRHTTFHTQLDEITIEDAAVRAAYERYLKIRRALGREAEPVMLMDLALVGARVLKSQGKLPDLDESEEVNACSVKIMANVDGAREPWLLLFKNETHNHPTEIEPYGGAATCIGGAIRDPLSGRAYVFQAMRVTGSGDPTAPLSETLPGKLPQRKIAGSAAAGFSAYGNQVGLATGLVDEIYHPGYAAKRMEIGVVAGAAPMSHIRRERPEPGDVVVLIGGRTGRDGVGGATGSSKAHDSRSLESCGAEVQKGNAPEERKLQRLFRDREAARLIKRCNDFGAGGVCVAVGELADGLAIDLDQIPKKYEGLDGTELAVSESQERMAVVLAPEDVKAFLQKARAENLEAAPIAKVTASPRLKMTWRGETIVDLSRSFLNSAGAAKHAAAFVEVLPQPETLVEPSVGAIVGTFVPSDIPETIKSLLRDLRFCSRKGLAERFDSTIGAAALLMPYGGKFQQTPSQIMAAKLPVDGETTTCVGMAYGFDPYLSEKNPYWGAYTAVADSAAKLIAAGFSRDKIWLSFQEYFERLRDDPKRWGKPLAALLGALSAQLDLGLAAIGGKDSMSGSFETLDVPPSLVSFSCAAGEAERVISPELKRVGSRVALLSDENVSAALDKAEKMIAAKHVLSAWAVGSGGAAEGLCKMAFGNRLGIKLDASVSLERLFSTRRMGFILELTEAAPLLDAELLGVTTEKYTLVIGGGPMAQAETDWTEIDLTEIERGWASRLDSVYPVPIPPHDSTAVKADAVASAIADTIVDTIVSSAAIPRLAPIHRSPLPKALVPVFPGANCELDTVRALRRAGADPETFLIRNLTPLAVEESIRGMAKAIQRCQMIILPGGFSGGDEPEGAAKLILSFFRNPRVAEAVHELLRTRAGLMLGICNGFQALVKLGLLPFGEIRGADAESPTLTYNVIGRHVSMLAITRVASARSPWMSLMRPGDLHTIAVSHGEGRFTASQAALRRLAEGDQIAAQYAGPDGLPTMAAPYNPNGSALAVEALTSPDGRVLGKMGHTERYARGLYRNVPGCHFQPLFEGGVSYFR